MNYYDELQVSPLASQEVIKVAYRKLTTIYHPDNLETGNEEKSKRLNEAYGVLSDEVKRKRYDREIKIKPETQSNREQDVKPKPKTDETESLLDRAYTELKYEKWGIAKSYFEKVLDRESANANAYIGVICADLKVSSERYLTNVKSPTDITNHEYYKRVIDIPEGKSRMNGYIKIINDRIIKERNAMVAKAKRQRADSAFNDACKEMSKARNNDAYRKVIIAFRNVDTDYPELNAKIKAKINECEQKILKNDFDNACKVMDSAKTLNDYDRAIAAFPRMRFNALSSYQDMNSKIKRKITECESKKAKIETAVREKHGLFLDRLNWLKRNLSLYTFHSTDAQKMRKEIEGIIVRNNTSSMTLKEVQNDLTVYECIFVNFHELFQDDFVLACLGLEKGLGRRGEITAVNVDAFFMKEFMEYNVL